MARVGRVACTELMCPCEEHGPEGLSRIAELEQANAEFSLDYDKARVQVSMADKMRQEAEQDRDRLEGDYSVLKKTHEEMSTTNMELGASYHTLKAEATRLTKELVVSLSWWYNETDS